MKPLNQILIIVAALSGLNCCSVDPTYEIRNQGLSFKVELNSCPETKAESLGLYSEGNRTSFTLERLPETKSVQINHSTTFTEIYDSFQVEGREHGNQVFYDFAQYNASTGLWSLQNAQYIWKPGKEIEVVAAATGRDNEAFFSGITYNGNPSTASFNYTLPEHADQQDFLVGYFRGVTDNGTVALKFNHPLTSLVFETGPLPLGVTLKVNSITLEGIDASARCDISFGENTTYTWSAHSGTVNYTQEIDKPAMVEGDVILGEDASFIVIPRKFPSNSEARILLNITENGRTYDLYAPLAGQEWNPGETNVYTISYHGENKAILVDGVSFNQALADISGRSYEEVYHPTIWMDPVAYRAIPDIKKIRFIVQNNDPELQTNAILVNVEGEKPIYMTYNSTSQTVTVSTEDFEIYSGANLGQMFKGLINLTSIEGLDKLNTAANISCSNMFAFCKKLTSFNLSKFNTEQCVSFSYMFAGCESLASINLSNFKTDNITSTSFMFYWNTRLNTITWGNNFQLPKATNLSYMFCGTPIYNLDLSFMIGSTSNITCIMMFAECNNLRTINIENLRGHFYRTWAMFVNCFNLRSINFGSFQTFEHNTQKVYMFQSTSLYSKNCNITCNETLKTALMTGTNMNTSWFTWTIVPQTF